MRGVVPEGPLFALKPYGEAASGGRWEEKERRDGLPKIR